MITRFDDAYWADADLDAYARDAELIQRWGLAEHTLPIRRERNDNPFTQNGAEWVAWHHGNRWCRRCKLDLKPTDESCFQCGAPAYGRLN